MRFSKLQQFILLTTASERGRTDRQRFLSFYTKVKKPPSQTDQQGIVTRSIERLISRGFLVGFGRRTPEKWFITHVRLTTAGRSAAKRLYGEQQRFRF